MKKLLAIALACLAAACVTNPETGEEEPNWPLIRSTISAVTTTARSSASFLDEPTRGDIMAICDAADQANDELGLWIESGAGGSDALAALKAVSQSLTPVIDRFVDDDDKPEVYAALVAVQGAIDIAVIVLQSET